MNATQNIKNKFAFTDKITLMAILNITPDSFFESSRITETENIKSIIAKKFADGADIIDIGAMSTAPNAKIISQNEEWQRIEPVLKIISKDFNDKLFSIDTFRAEIAKRAVNDYGISIINDISGGDFDDKMFDVVAQCDVPYILMHRQGNLENMHTSTNYKFFIEDVMSYFHNKISELNSLGVSDIVIDPGFGFSKTVDQNYILLNNLDRFKIFNLPLLAGLSRKTMLWKYLDLTPDNALNATSVINTIALYKGANILRVHDVVEARQVIDLFLKTENSLYY